MNPRCVLICAVLVATLTAPLAGPAGAATVQTDETAPARIPWWGPTDGNEGWHLRVPVTVESGMSGSVDNLPATAEIDLGEVSQQAGWLTRNVAGRQVLESFTLDRDSVRVVEYTNFQLPRIRSTDAHLVPADEDLPEPQRYTVPAQVVKGFWDAEQGGPFDPTRNPTLTLRWIMPGTTEPSQTRHFMVYFEIDENGGAPGQDPERVDESRVNGLDWIGRGTSIVGMGNQVHVTALHADTSVRVQTYSGREPRLVQEGEATLQAGQTRTFRIARSGTAWLVEASGPIVASSHSPWGPRPPPYSHEMGFFPSWDGTLLGTRWSMPIGGPRVVVYNPADQPASVRVGDQSTFILSGGAEVFANQGSFLDAEASHPVLIQGRNQEAEQYPFVSDTGAPTGERMFGLVEGARTLNTDGTQGWRQPQAQELQATNLGPEHVLVRLETVPEHEQVLPRPGPATDSPGIEARPWPDWLTYNPSQAAVGPMELTVLDSEDPSLAVRDPSLVAVGGPVSAITGATGPARVASPLGGEDARNFSAPRPVHVVAWHNATQLTVSTEEGQPERFALNRHQHRFIDQGPVTIRASKPVAVFPDSRIAYGAGHLEPGRVEVGIAQYRGPLLSLSPEEGDEPMVRSISFGANTTFELTVENRGRAVDGSPIADQAVASIPETPPGWNATVEPKRLELPPDGTADLTVRVQAPETRGSGDRLALPVQLSSVTNPNMTDEVTTITLLREQRGVGLWFEQEDGPNELTLRFQPGQDRRVPVVVKNTGSAADTFRLNVANAEAGWGASFHDAQGGTVRSLSLASGQARTLELSVSPPAPGSVPVPASLSLTATSTNDTTVSAKALLDGLVATESDLDLTTETPVILARPGEEVTVPLSLHNEGETVQDVQLNATGDLPPGWSDPAFLFRGESLAPVNNRLNSVSPTSNEGLPLELALTVPDAAEGGVTTSLMLQARSVGLGGGEPDLLPLNVHVEPFVEITQAPASPLTVPPGGSRQQAISLANEGNVEANLTVQPISLPAGLQVDHPRTLTIPARGNTSLDLRVAVPAGHAAGELSVELVLVDDSGASTRVEVPVRIPEGPRLTASTLDTERIVAGVATNLTLAVENTGNAPSNATLETSAPAGWTIGARPEAVRLAPTQAQTVRLTLQPPAGADEPSPIELAARENARAETLANATLTPVVADVGLKGVGTLEEGTEGTIAARGAAVNHANVTLHDVTVALVGDGEILSTTTLDRVPPQAPRTVVVTASPDEVPGQLRLVLDPHERIPEADRSDNTAPVTPEGESLDTPVASWLPWIAALAAVLLAGHRADRRRG